MHYGVPDLQLNYEVSHFHPPRGEFHAQCGLILLAKATVDEHAQQSGLADAGVAHHDVLEQIVVLGSVHQRL